MLPKDPVILITQSLSAIDCSYSRERNQFVRT